MIDIFGYEKTIEGPGAILTSEFANVSLGGRMALVQSCQAQYARQIQSMFEAGASVVYYNQGASEGNINVNAAVGSKGFFLNFNNLSGSCGAIDKVSIDVRTGNGCLKGGGGGISFAGAMAESFNVSFQSGPVAVTEGVGIRVGAMSVRSSAAGV
jgi:hypothetical protein